MRENIIIFLLILLALMILIALFTGIKAYMKATDERFTKLWKLKKHGLIAKGNLINTKGIGVGDEVQVEMEFEVTNDKNETWFCKFTEYIPVQNAYMLKPGTIFDILYDPDDTSNSMIKWP